MEKMAEYGGAISVSQARESQSSEDEENEQSPRSGAGSVMVRSGTGDLGSSTKEVARKPRGRPPGSKNKPKPPIVITRDSESAMRPVILEVSSGSDIVEMVSHFARRRQVGLCVLSGSGTVANLTLRHPTSHTATLSITGRFEILSLSGSFPAPSSSSSSSKSPPPPPLTISLAGTQGQVIGGTVAGTLIAASPVVLVAASFVNPSFHRLPADDEDATEVKPKQGSESVYSVAAPTPLNCQIPPDVLPWIPTSRPPPY